MTKPLPTGCIKNSKKIPSLREFNLIIEGISHEDKIGHLFIVDIDFNTEKATRKRIYFNEFYTPIFEKKKVLLLSKRSVFQLLDAMRVNDQGLLNSYKVTAKTHSTMDKKIFLLLYTEHISFLIKMCGLLLKRNS